MKKQFAIAIIFGLFLATIVAAQSVGNVAVGDGDYYMGPGMMYGNGYGYNMMSGYAYPNVVYSDPSPQNQVINVTNILLGILIVAVIVLIAIMLSRRR